MMATKSRTPNPNLTGLSSVWKEAADRNEDSNKPWAINLDYIEEDPSQPRKNFDPVALAELAESIRVHGLLQPIGVVRRTLSSYRIVFGARRFRAAQMARLLVIPAIVLNDSQATVDVQLIENLQRANLTNTEIVSGLVRMRHEGKGRSDIARLIGWDADRVKLFLNLEGAPAFILDRLDRIAVRAAYDLFQAWKKTPAAIEQAVEGREELTYPEVRVIVAQALASKKPAENAPTVHGAPLQAPAVAPPELLLVPPDKEPEAHQLTRPARQERKSGPRKEVGLTRVIVADASRTGILMTTRVAGDGHVFVIFDDAEQEIAVTELRLIGIRQDSDSDRTE